MTKFNDRCPACGELGGVQNGVCDLCGHDQRPDGTCDSCPGHPRDVEGSIAKNPVHEHTDGSWGFWDETWAHCYGGFTTEAEAQAGCVKYAKEELGD